jgi:hypothetical protein
MLRTRYPVVPCPTRGRHPLGFHDAGPAEAAKPRLLDRFRAAARLRRHSRLTEAAYVASPNDMTTTMIYAYVLNQAPADVTSPGFGSLGRERRTRPSHARRSA